jgi:hypothetical protein
MNRYTEDTRLNSVCSFAKNRDPYLPLLEKRKYGDELLPKSSIVLMLTYGKNDKRFHQMILQILPFVFKDD